MPLIILSTKCYWFKQENQQGSFGWWTVYVYCKRIHSVINTAPRLARCNFATPHSTRHTTALDNMSFCWLRIMDRDCPCKSRFSNTEKESMKVQVLLVQMKQNKRTNKTSLPLWVAQYRCDLVLDLIQKILKYSLHFKQVTFYLVQLRCTLAHAIYLWSVSPALTLAQF